MTGALIALLAGAAIALVAYLVLAMSFSEDRQVRRRLKRMSAYEEQQANNVEPLTLSFFDRVIRPAGANMSGSLRGLAPGSYFANAGRMIALAGNPGSITAEGMLAAKIIAAFLVSALSFISGLLVSGSAATAVVVGLVFGIGAFFLPELWLRSRITERQTQIRRALPDMLDMLMISVEAGLGFDAAVTKYIQNTRGPLPEEFSRMLYETQAGLSRREALKHLSERTEVPDLDSFIMSMTQADIFGVSVSSVLRTQSREMRVKRRQFAEEIAQKAPAKMVFPLILCILPATLIVLMGPVVVSVGQAFGMLGK